MKWWVNLFPSSHGQLVASSSSIFAENEFFRELAYRLGWKREGFQALSRRVVARVRSTWRRRRNGREGECTGIKLFSQTMHTGGDGFAV